MRVANALVRHCPQISIPHLVQVIDRVHPDIIYSMDFQSGGYLTLAAKQQMSTFPVWVAANLGSDIYHFQQYPDHRERIKRVLAACDYYACECHRDVLLANNLGLKGDSLPVTPIAGGLRFDTLPATVPPSQRRCIAVNYPRLKSWASSPNDRECDGRDQHVDAGGGGNGSVPDPIEHRLPGRMVYRRRGWVSRRPE
jgi:hypothetical protein